MTEARAMFNIPEEGARTGPVEVTLWYDAAGVVDLISVAGSQGRQTMTPRQFAELRALVDEHGKLFP